MSGQRPVEPRGDSGAALRRLTERVEVLVGDRGNDPAIRKSQIDKLLSEAISIALQKAFKPDGILYSSTGKMGRIGAIIEDQRAVNTDGGNFASAGDRIRVLNTLVYNNGLVALAGNQFTLPAGTYFVVWSAPAYRVNTHQSWLYNVTDAAVVARGSTERSDAVSPDATSRSSGSAVITISGSKAFEIRHRCNTTSGNGFGPAGGYGIEVFTRVEIYQLA